MGLYTEEDLRILETQENDFRYPSFMSRDALTLGLAIIKEAEKETRGIVVQIVRESDEFVLFRYGMDDKAQRNYMFAEMKRQAVKKYLHSSAWVYVSSEISDLNERTSGGSFPVFLKDGSLAATVSVSGLHESHDHNVIISALEKVFSKKTVPFEKELI